MNTRTEQDISMAFAQTAPHAIATPGTSGIVARIRMIMARRAAYAQTRRELSALSDRELNDIGLSRYDIERIACESRDMI
jgi:uncharacterized protein YjiS (DUF1127 family)